MRRLPGKTRAAGGALICVNQGRGRRARRVAWTQVKARRGGNLRSMHGKRLEWSREETMAKPIPSAIDLGPAVDEIAADAARGDTLDRLTHAWQARFTASLSPSGLLLAFADWAMHL